LKKLVAYLTSGFPDKNFTIDLALSLKDNGVDSLELGIPFSDPVADGPIIEKANYLALNSGVNFNMVKEISKDITPFLDTLWMGYYNSFYQQNFDTLTKEASTLGISGFIIPDLPFEESLLHQKIMQKENIANISFVAPTDDQTRIKTIIKNAQKFIYLVAYTGITGAEQKESLENVISNIREYSQTPLYVGFGVNEKTAKEKAKGVDGVIVGSAFVAELLKENKTKTEKIKAISNIAKQIKENINS